MVETNSIWQSLNEIYNDTLKFRDYYAINNSLENYSNKNKDIAEKINEGLAKCDSFKEVAEKDEGQFLIYKGMICMINDLFYEKAFDFLMRGIKLKPKMIVGWLELSEYYLANQNLEMAEACLENALKKDPNNTEALRKKSTYLRYIDSTSRSKNSHLEASLKLALKALELDKNDPKSWYSVGNAYLTLFIKTSQKAEHMSKAVSSFEKAVQFKENESLAELYFNFSTALKFVGEYQKSLELMEHVLLYDPEFPEAQANMEECLNYLQTVQTIVDNKGNLKPRKMQKILSSFQGKQASIDQAHDNFKVVDMKDLNSSSNPNCMVQGMVVGSMLSPFNQSFTVCLMDKLQNCALVTIYNLGLNNGIMIGDALSIPEPYVIQVNFKYKQQDFNFQNIFVKSYKDLYLNGKKISSHVEAVSTASISFLKES